MVNIGPLASLGEAVPLEFTSAEPVGTDLRVLARVPGRADF
jgi:diaminohydroxyphosphoribosylaminopyrimidine deaminase/5-amino-6-(5-phosphoribosylamino)uracil reductase